MAPNLTASQHNRIRDIILARTLTTAQMAIVASCSERLMKAIRSNLRYSNLSKTPFNGGGRCRSLTPPMLLNAQQETIPILILLDVRYE
jgi:hypothetical protein